MYDAHCHLQDERLKGCREAVFGAAAAAGIEGGCCCGCEPGDWRTLRALAENRRGAAGFQLLAAFGVHPWYAGNLPAGWLTQLEEYLLQHPAAPVGEIGLDGLRDDPPRDLQRQVLVAQLELAARLNRPVVLHGACAWGELLASLHPFAPRLPGFVLHAFGGSEDLLRDAVAMGGYVSFAGTVCNPAAKRVRLAATTVPAERLLIETDAPDMAPAERKTESGIPPELNHPANLVYVARVVAQLRGLPAEELAILTTANAQRVYRITDRV